MNALRALRAAVASPTRLRDLATTEIGAATLRAVSSVQDFLDDLARDPQASLVPRLAGARQHLLRAPGKMVRPIIVTLLGRALGVDETKTRPYALAVELIHTASLLHDDVIDRAETRRHQPTANATYDNTLPILAGDGILAEVMDRVAAEGDIVAVQAIAATIQDLVAGEAWQYELRGTAHDDVRACIEVAELKTGALLSLCTWLPGRLAGRDELALQSFAAIGRYTGVSFQIIDDLLDFEAAETGKPALGDWAEGKTNVMTAHLLGLAPRAQPRLAELFRAPGSLAPDDYQRVLRETFTADELAEARRRVESLAAEYATLAEDHARVVPDNNHGRLFEKLRKSLLVRVS